MSHDLVHKKKIFYLASEQGWTATFLVFLHLQNLEVLQIIVEEMWLLPLPIVTEKLVGSSFTRCTCLAVEAESVRRQCPWKNF